MVGDRGTVGRLRPSTVGVAFAGVLLAVACNAQSSADTAAAPSQTTIVASPSAGPSSVIQSANAASAAPNAAAALPVRASVDNQPGFVTFKEKVEAVGALAFLPPSETTALSSSCNVTRIWDVATGTVLRRYEGPEWSFSTVVFTRDGARAFSPVDGGVMEWEVATGRVVRRFAMAPEELPYSIAVSPDEQTLAAASWRAAFVWSVGSGDVVRKPDAAASHALGYIDNTTLGWVDRVGSLCRGAVRGEEPPSCLELDGGGGMDAAVFAGGWVVGSDKWGGLEVWDAQTGKTVRSWEADSQALRFGGVTPSGLLVTTSVTQKVKVWQLPEGREIARRSINNSNSALAISSDGRQVLLSPKSTTIARWTLP